MIPRVDFYLCEQADQTTVLHTVCRIIEKAYTQEHQLLILCVDQKQEQTLDTLLWTFRDIGFIPHTTLSQATTIPAPIIICHTSHPSSLEKHDILINLTESVPENIDKYNRVIEIVSSENSAREKARQRYRYYRDQGLDLHSHQVS